MKFTCTQSDLSKGLAIVGHALSSRPTLPILSCVHLSTEAGRLTLGATNLEIGISYDLAATVEEAGALALPARLLTEFVKSLPIGPVTLTVPEGELTALVTGQRSRAHIRGMDSSEYPKLSIGPEAQMLCRFEAVQLKEAIAQVAFAAATDESRPVLCAVLLRGNEDHVTLAAADAFRLAVRELPIVAEGIPEQPLGDLLVPAKTLSELVRILPSDGQVDLRIAGNGSQAWFQTDHLRLGTRLIEGAYPNYTQIVPTTHETQVVVQTAALRTALKAVSPFARDRSNLTRLHIMPGTEAGPGVLTVEASSEDLGNTVSTLEASVDGSELTLNFNVEYLQAILAAIPTPEVKLFGVDPFKPGVFSPTGTVTATYVVMPMHLNSERKPR